MTPFLSIGQNSKDIEQIKHHCSILTYFVLGIMNKEIDHRTALDASDSERFANVRKKQTSFISGPGFKTTSCSPNLLHRIKEKGWLKHGL